MQRKTQKRRTMSKNDGILRNEDGTAYDVPVDGSLGLLALGYVGVMSWREARQKAGYDLIGIRKQEWDLRQKEWEEKQTLLEAKRKEFLDKKKAEKKLGDSSSDPKGSNKK